MVNHLLYVILRSQACYQQDFPLRDVGETQQDIPPLQTSHSKTSRGDLDLASGSNTLHVVIVLQLQELVREA